MRSFKSRAHVAPRSSFSANASCELAASRLFELSSKVTHCTHSQHVPRFRRHDGLTKPVLLEPSKPIMSHPWKKRSLEFLPEGKVWSCLIHTAVCWTLKDGTVDVQVSGNKHKNWDVRDGHGTTLVLYDACSVDFR